MRNLYLAADESRIINALIFNETDRRPKIVLMYHNH